MWILRLWVAIMGLALAVSILSPAATAQEQGWLGIEIQDLKPEDVAALGLDDINGVRVIKPIPGGPAEKAGLLAGDVILEVDGKGAANTNDFLDLISAIEPRANVRLKVSRGRQMTLLEAALAARPAPQANAADLDRLLDYVSETTEPEARIRTARKALEIEQGIIDWTLPDSRAWVRGWLWGTLGNTYSKRVAGNKASNQEKAIAAYEHALKDFRRDQFPKEWTQTQTNIGLVYLDRKQGQKTENAGNAIAAFEAGLSMINRDESPRDWALAHNHLGRALWMRPDGDRAADLERAIFAYEAALTVFSRETAPREWAMTQANLGSALADRIHGTRIENIEKAIIAYEAALTVWTRETLPEAWAWAEYNVGLAYFDRVLGDPADNRERAIAFITAALEVFTRADFPSQWASAKNALGNCYVGRARGIRSENAEMAIAAFREALTVRTLQDFAQEWSETQANLGNALLMRVEGDREQNIEESIGAYKLALKEFSFDITPEKWANVQQNLAGAYLLRGCGDWSDNYERAIAHLEAALTIRTPKKFPNEWASTQNVLAFAYTVREAGDASENLGKALAAVESALLIYTPASNPRMYIRAETLRGEILLRRLAFNDAANAFQKAREIFVPLLDETSDTVAIGELSAAALGLYQNSAYVAAQMGDAEAAFSLANEGKALFLKLHLRLHALKLSPDQRQQLERLQSEIRAIERTIELASGGGRAALLDQIASKRRDLQALVKRDQRELRTSALAHASGVVLENSALVVPLVTEIGAKFLILRGGRNNRVVSLDLPEFTTKALTKVVAGDEIRGGVKAGWLGAFMVQRLPPNERDARFGEWIGAIEDIGPELWVLFAGPLDAELKRLGLKPGARLVWMPTGALGLLPVGLAQDSATGARLGDTYEIAITPSLDALAAAHADVVAKPLGLGAIVNPTGDLAFTEVESDLVAVHFNQRTVVVRDAATPEAAFAAITGKTYWHISSHAFFDWDDARASGLIMRGNQPLTVGALLEAEGLGRPRLVVLSACETGLYDILRNPDEFIGLPSAFMALGAAGVLSTLWQVDDRATALLIARFYDLHLGQGRSPPAALKQAQAWLKGATRRELIAYAKEAATSGDVDRALSAKLETSLTHGAHQNTRFAAISAAIATRGRAGGVRVAKNPEGEADLDERPFEHPYFWGGFMLTGM